MNKIIFISLIIAIGLLIALDGHCQLGNNFKFEAKPDSIIEKRQEGYIYITSDTNSRLYEWIIPNPNNDLVKSIYSDYIEHILKNYSFKIGQFGINRFPRKWNSVYMYKKEYFLYAPSDWMANSGFYISDSALYITSSDPGDIYLIKEFHSTGVENGDFRVINYNGETLNINIKIIESSLGIYQWTIKNQGEEIQKLMMQNSDFSKKLKMIVCDCGRNKCIMEFPLPGM